MTNKEKKLELLKKINELAQMCSINGILSEDKQALLIGESIKVILVAACNKEHSKMLQKYFLQFLEEVEILTGEKTLQQYLCSDLERIAN